MSQPLPLPLPPTGADADASFWDLNSWSEWGSSIIDSVDKFFSQENIDYALSALQDLFTPIVEIDESKDNPTHANLKK